MNDRQRIIVRLALSFMLSNMTDIEELFRVESDDPNHPAYGNDDKLDYNGDIIDKPTEAEIEELMFVLQG